MMDESVHPRKARTRCVADTKRVGRKRREREDAKTTFSPFGPYKGRGTESSSSRLDFWAGRAQARDTQKLRRHDVPQRTHRKTAKSGQSRQER